jgi:hypothetical protein
MDAWKQEAATTELSVAGLAQWVRFVRNRWQEEALLCAWPITFESREKFLKEVAAVILEKGKKMLSLLKVRESCIE